MNDQLTKTLLRSGMLKMEDLGVFEINVSERDLDIDHIINIYKVRIAIAKDNKLNTVSQLQKLVVDLEKNKSEGNKKVRTAYFKNKNFNFNLFVDLDCTKIVGMLNLADIA
jgi:hypothetical protein